MRRVAEALQTWRDAERLLAQLDPTTAAYRNVSEAVTAAHQAYSSVCGDAPSEEALARCEERIGRIRVTLEQVRRGLEGSSLAELSPDMGPFQSSSDSARSV